MPHTPHALADEFPSSNAHISALKGTDAHFATVVAEYDAVNLAVYRAESRLDLITEEDEEHLRRARAALKDQIWARIK
jgi:uncharacterized protein YdcH (DUF465 family)